MFIFKTIMCICSVIFIYKAIIENILEKAYDYLFYETIMFALVILIKPIV